MFSDMGLYYVSICIFSIYLYAYMVLNVELYMSLSLLVYFLVHALNMYMCMCAHVDV